MDVRAPGADPHARLRVVAITLYHGEGEGEGLSRSGAGSTHAGRGRYRLGIRCIIFILTLVTGNKRKRLIAKTRHATGAALSAPDPRWADPRSGVSCRVSCSLVQGHRPISINPPPYDGPQRLPCDRWARGARAVC